MRKGKGYLAPAATGNRQNHHSNIYLSSHYYGIWIWRPLFMIQMIMFPGETKQMELRTWQRTLPPSGEFLKNWSSYGYATITKPELESSKYPMDPTAVDPRIIPVVVETPTQSPDSTWKNPTQLPTFKLVALSMEERKWDRKKVYLSAEVTEHDALLRGWRISPFSLPRRLQTQSSKNCLNCHLLTKIQAGSPGQPSQDNNRLWGIHWYSRECDSAQL